MIINECQGSFGPGCKDLGFTDFCDPLVRLKALRAALWGAESVRTDVSGSKASR